MGGHWSKGNKKNLWSVQASLTVMITQFFPQGICHLGVIFKWVIRTCCDNVHAHLINAFMPHAQLYEVCKGLFGLLPSVSAVVKDAHAWLEFLIASKSHLNFWNKFLCPSLLLDSLDKRRKTVKGLGGRRTPLLQGRYKDNTLLGTGKREEEVDEDIEPAVLQPVQLLLLHQQLSPLFLLLLSLASLWCVQNVFGSQKSSRKDLWPLHLRVFQFFKNSFWLSVAYLQELSLCLCIYVGIPKYCCASFTTVRILHGSKQFTFFRGILLFVPETVLTLRSSSTSRSSKVSASSRDSSLTIVISASILEDNSR